MHLKTKIIIAAVPVAAAAVAGVVIVTRKHLRRLRRKEDSSFLSNDVRDALQALCSLKGEDFVPDGPGTSLYQRRLDELTDRQLIGVYVLIKVAETLHARGTDFHQLSKAEVLREVALMRDATHRKHSRHELLKQLGSLGIDTAKSVLADGLMLASMSTQAA